MSSLEYPDMEKLVSLDNAITLKQLNFLQGTFWYYNHSGDLKTDGYKPGFAKNNKLDIYEYTAPSFKQTKEWLYRHHGIGVTFKKQLPVGFTLKVEYRKWSTIPYLYTIWENIMPQLENLAMEEALTKALEWVKFTGGFERIKNNLKPIK